MYFKQARSENFSKSDRPKSAVRFLVTHFTANDGDTAQNNCLYFAREIVKASANYFVDEIEVACSVPWYYPAYHCGGRKYPNAKAPFHGKCANYNSIAVEMCSRKDKNGKFYIPEETLENAAHFIAEQMIEFNIPIDRVIRHYDVTGKNCPAPLVNEREWVRFKKMVEMEVQGMKRYNKLEEIPAGVLRDTIKKLMDEGVVKGSSDGLNLSHDMVRTLVFMERMRNADK